jgi:hypothetical protein
MIFENNENDGSVLETVKNNANWVGEAIQGGAKFVKEQASGMIGEAIKPKPSVDNCEGGKDLPSHMKVAQINSHVSNPSRKKPCEFKEVATIRFVAIMTITLNLLPYHLPSAE